MTGEIGGEMLGDVAQGALAARAAEPAHGEGGDGHSRESACLNCGTALVGSHCHSCGQAAHVHKTLGAFWHDLLHGVFHFEGKIWRTLPRLLFSPGRLTREYIDGRRASYVSPIALFLFCVFLMFAVVKQVAGGIAVDPAKVVNGGTANLAQGITLTQTQLDKLRRDREALAAKGQPTAALDQEIASQVQAIDIMREVKSGTSPAPGNGNVSSDIPAIDKALKRFAANPALVLYQLQNNAYKYSWALIPLSVPFVWLLFPFSRRFRLYDHTVFVTYSLCFMSLLAVLVAAGNALGAPFIAALVGIAPPLHMYKQLRGTYGLTRAGALWRTAALLVIALTALMLFTVLILAETGG